MKIDWATEKLNVREDGFVDLAGVVLGIVRIQTSGWFSFNLGSEPFGPFKTRKEALEALARPAELPMSVVPEDDAK